MTMDSDSADVIISNMSRNIKFDYWLNESVKDIGFEDMFEVDAEIECGPFGRVLKCHPIGNPGFSVCAKVLQKNQDKKVVQREVSLILKLKHPNVCRLIEVIESPEEIFLIHEYLAGGQVLEGICKRTKYNERVATKILKQLLEGLKYIHQEGITHNNLKPENFMFSKDSTDDCLVKITDTALFPILDRDLLKTSLDISAQYCAPETLRNEIGNPASDMWSLGAFAYTLLTGEEPFKVNSKEELYIKILKGDYDVESANYKKLSINAKDFIIKLLMVDPRKRMTVYQALNNQWLLGKAASLKGLPLENMEALLTKKRREVYERSLIVKPRVFDGEVSLCQRYLPENIWDILRNGGKTHTKYHTSLIDCIRSGLDNSDSSIGLYAPDADCYDVFQSIFWPVISEYHKVDLEDLKFKHDFGDPERLPELEGKFAKPIVSTRIRVARSIEGFPLASKLTPDTRMELKDRIVQALKQFSKGEFFGNYHDLVELTEEDKYMLIEDHFLFNDASDKYLESAGGYGDWPHNRGIFINKLKTFVVWLNEEDHLRVISIQKGSNVKQVYARLVQGVEMLERQLTFTEHKKFGYLTFCPSNIGTGLRASVHVKLPRLAAAGRLQKLCNELNLQVRGVNGEHTESEGGVFDISNKVRIGKTEYELVRSMILGVKALIKAELKTKVA